MKILVNFTPFLQCSQGERFVGAITHFISLISFWVCYSTSKEFKTSGSLSSFSLGYAVFPWFWPAGINTYILRESSANWKRRN